MSEAWATTEGTGWLDIPGFGQINPRRDNVNGGRQYFTAKTSAGGYARVTGETITEGPETWHFEFDQPFFLADAEGRCFETTISLLPEGRYAVRTRPGTWPAPAGATGGW